MRHIRVSLMEKHISLRVLLSIYLIIRTTFSDCNKRDIKFNLCSVRNMLLYVLKYNTYLFVPAYILLPKLVILIITSVATSIKREIFQNCTLSYQIS